MRRAIVNGDATAARFHTALDDREAQPAAAGFLCPLAFSASRNSGKTDLLQFFDNSVAGFNKSPARIYS